MARVSLSAAIDEVASRDPVLARLVALAEPIRYLPREAGHFDALVSGIVYQQLAPRALRLPHGARSARPSSRVVRRRFTPRSSRRS